jgi:hypothetical protein
MRVIVTQIWHGKGAIREGNSRSHIDDVTMQSPSHDSDGRNIFASSLDDLVRDSRFAADGDMSFPAVKRTVPVVIWTDGESESVI